MWNDIISISTTRQTILVPKYFLNTVKFQIVSINLAFKYLNGDKCSRYYCMEVHKQGYVLYSLFFICEVS